jgi:hypothetical protein
MTPNLVEFRPEFYLITSHFIVIWGKKILFFKTSKFESVLSTAEVDKNYNL